MINLIKIKCHNNIENRFSYRKKETASTVSFSCDIFNSYNYFMNQIKQYKQDKYNFVSIEGNNFKVILCDLAATLYQVWFDNKIMTTQVQDLKDFTGDWTWFGKTIGRVAGRIPAILTIDDKQYQLQPNEMGNVLHGGKEGISRQIFDLKDIKTNNDITTVTYQYLSPDGQSGFVGNLLLTIIYEIDTANHSIKIVFRSKCDKKSPINITNHSFFSLGDRDIKSLRLLVKANSFVYPRGLDLMPMEVRPIVECLDFNKFKLVKQDINSHHINYGRARGYDHFFIFTNKDPNIVQVMLENDLYHLDVYTDYSGAKIYSDNFTDNIKCINTDNYYHRGIAIEPQCAANSNLIVEPNKQIEHWVKFIFSKR